MSRWDLGRCHTSTTNLSPPSAFQSQAGPSISMPFSWNLSLFPSLLMVLSSFLFTYGLLWSSPPLCCSARKVSFTSFALLSSRVQWSLQCCTGPEDCHLNSPSFHSPGTIHLVCNPNFLSTLPPITNISNSKAFSHTGWKQWPFPLDWFCLQLFILFLHVKVLA